jgi:hypothetical protein
MKKGPVAADRAFETRASGAYSVTTITGLSSRLFRSSP